MSVSEHRKKLFELMPDNSLLILHSGSAPLANEDEYYNFQVNSNFFYLTDLTRAGMILLMAKFNGREIEQLFIEATDAFTERWTGKMPKSEEVSDISGISNIEYTKDFSSAVSGIMGYYNIEEVYFDCYRCSMDDQPTYNLEKASEFKAVYPFVNLKDARNLIMPLRETKDSEEIARTREAVKITKYGLDNVLKYLNPNLTEYQAQAIFEGSCMYNGANGLAFPTISACGINACSMHYDSNRDALKDGTLLLMDLGAAYKGYCSDVTRTYPVNGRFTERQKQIYELVLKANKAVAEKAAPGIARSELEELTCSILGEGLVSLGLIENASDVRKYYMHGVSHSIGINSHDPEERNMVLRPGCIISDEPGLYIDEEEIGIRIEDDLLITETGCEVLSASIPKELEEIEAIMSCS